MKFFNSIFFALQKGSFFIAWSRLQFLEGRLALTGVISNPLLDCLELSLWVNLTEADEKNICMSLSCIFLEVCT